MANKKDLRNNMIRRQNCGLDNLIQPITQIQESEQLNKEKAVHYNFIIN